MCGRYLIDISDKEMKEILGLLNTYYGVDSYSINEIFPSNDAPILVGVNHKVKPTIMHWGFKGFDNKEIINARSETIKDKKLFSTSFIEKRCVIPTSGFYEWKKIDRDSSNNRKSQKYHFSLEYSSMMYLAGIYQGEALNNRYVIITTNANTSMQSYHHRMPLILEKSQVKDWLFNNNKAEQLLQQIPVNVMAKKIL